MNHYNLVLNRTFIPECATNNSVVVLLFLSKRYSTPGSNLTLVTLFHTMLGVFFYIRPWD